MCPRHNKFPPVQTVHKRSSFVVTRQETFGKESKMRCCVEKKIVLMPFVFQRTLISTSNIFQQVLSVTRLGVHHKFNLRKPVGFPGFTANGRTWAYFLQLAATAQIYRCIFICSFKRVLQVPTRAGALRKANRQSQTQTHHLDQKMCIQESLYFVLSREAEDRGHFMMFEQESQSDCRSSQMNSDRKGKDDDGDNW